MNKCLLLIILIVLCTLFASTSAYAADAPATKPAEPKKPEWNGYEILNFKVDGRGALLVADDVGNTIWRVTPRPK